MASLDDKWAQLPPDKQQQVADLIEFLLARTKQGVRNNQGEKKDQQTFTTALEVLQGRLREAGERLLGLGSDWDGEGSQGYVNVTVERAQQFVLNLFQRVWQDRIHALPLPSLQPGIEGEVDIHFKTPKFELLLSVPRDHGEQVSFYGDDYAANKIKGTLKDAECLNVVASWVIPLL